MITELDVLDHVILDENEKSMLMLIFDSSTLWQVNKSNNWNVFKYNKMVREKNLEHLLYLKKKVESYVNYILDNGIIKSFPNCIDYSTYGYEIRVVTDFMPDNDYIATIDNLNKYISKTVSNVIITHERRIDEK